MESKNIIYELLGRPLNIGDFVLELSDYTFENSYGIVVSTKEVYTKHGIVKPKKVYKVENPVNKEIEIRNKVLESYTIYQAENMKKQSLLGKYKRGDIVSYGYYYYLYLGKVNSKLYYNGNEILNKSGHGYLLLTTNYNKDDMLDFTITSLEDVFSKLPILKGWDGRCNGFSIYVNKSNKFIPTNLNYNINVNKITVNYCDTSLQVTFI